jgi:ADP-heptose:LPS heptosyltransferase
MTLTELRKKIAKKQEVKIIIRQSQAPGDILTLTATIRDLKRQYPFIRICMKTSCHEIWENNPYIENFEDDEVDYDFKAEYPLVNKANQCGQHMIHGFRLFISNKLKIPIQLYDFKCDVTLSEEEKRWTNQVEEEFGYTGDFWLINCGSKNDFPLKQWEPKRWKQFVKRMKGKITFVQVGASEHNHPTLDEDDHVFNLVGKTDLRQLIRLAYHSSGVIGGVSMLNHLASAFELPSIVVAGSRETATWEGYNNSQYIHRIGTLDCCKSGGCWKSKKEECKYLEDNDFPKCLNSIHSIDIERAIQPYL